MMEFAIGMQIIVWSKILFVFDLDNEGIAKNLFDFKFVSCRNFGDKIGIHRSLFP